MYPNMQYNIKLEVNYFTMPNIRFKKIRSKIKFHDKKKFMHHQSTKENEKKKQKSVHNSCNKQLKFSYLFFENDAYK